MSIIQMTEEQGNSYRCFLNDFRTKFNKEPGPQERTEAFFCARSNNPWNLPSWYKD
jgi:hypothetical protein